MTSEVKKISITRALVELKRLGDQINSAILTGKFVARTQGKNSYRKVIGSNDSVEAMNAKIQGSFDKVEALIANREKMKSAIVLSNATTKVMVLGREMTVAEAIELKATIDFRTAYRNQLRGQLMVGLSEVEKANTALDTAIEVSVNTIFSSEKSKVDADTLRSVSGPQKEQKEAALLDPAKIESRIEKLSNEISELTFEVDFILSESNAKTIIEV